MNKSKTGNFPTYGFNKNSDYPITNVRKKINHSIFDLKLNFSASKIKNIKNIVVNLIGDHNITNATASIAIALNLGIKINYIKQALKKFLGIQRRFTKVFTSKRREF